MAKRWLQSVDLEIDEQGRPLFETALVALAALIADGRLKVDAAGVTLSADLVDLDVEAITGTPPNATDLYQLQSAMETLLTSSAEVAAAEHLYGIDQGTSFVLEALTAHGPGVGLADYLADMFGFGGQYGSNPLYMAGPDLSVAELIGELIYNLASASPLYMPGPGISLSEGLQAAFFNSPMMGSPLFYNSSGNPMLGGAPIGELIGDLVSGEGNLLDSPLFDPNNQAGVGEMVGYVWSALNMAMAPDSTFPPFFDQSDGTPLADILDMGLANAQNRLDYIETRLVASNDDLGVAEYFDQTNAIGPLYDSVNGLSVADLLSGEVGPGLGYVISALSDIDTKLAAVKAVTDQMTLVDVAEGGKGLQVVDTTAGGGG